MLKNTLRIFVTHPFFVYLHIECLLGKFVKTLRSVWSTTIYWWEIASRKYGIFPKILQKEGGQNGFGNGIAY